MNEPEQTTQKRLLVGTTFRQLTPEEQEVVAREARELLTISNVPTWVMGFLSMGMVVLAVVSFPHSPPVGLMTATTALILGVLARLPYVPRDLLRLHPQSEARAYHALCTTQLELLGKSQTRVHCVGPLRVRLRAGYHEFWPEGQTAQVELCLLHNRDGNLLRLAILLSLQGLTVEQCRRRPPPRSWASWWIFLATLMSFATLILTLVISRDGFWADAASALRNLGRANRFANVTELLRTPSARRAEVFLAKTHRITVTEYGSFLCDLNDEALRRLQADLATAPEDTPPSEADVTPERLKGCIDGLERIMRLGRETDTADYETALRRIEATCRRNSLALLEDQYEESVRQRQEHRRRVAQSLRDSTDTCANSHDTPAARDEITALVNQKGRLLSANVWQEGGRNGSLRRLFLLLGAVALTALAVRKAVGQRQRDATVLRSWSQQIRQHAQPGQSRP